MLKAISVTACLVGFVSVAGAHFVFVLPQGGATAQVVLNEDLKPSEEVDFHLLSGAKLTIRGEDGKEDPLTLTPSDHCYVAALPGAGDRLIHGAVDLGIMYRGQEKGYILVYYPKTIIGNAFNDKLVVGTAAPVEIVPIGTAGSFRLQLLAGGQPQAGKELTIILPGGKQQKIQTDQKGQSGVLIEGGRYGAWARYWEPKGGERDGKTYVETRNYATLVFDLPAGGSSVPASPEPKTTATRYATLPQAASSFGAAFDKGWLYIYGGHIALTHSYSIEAVSGSFARLRTVSSGASWEQLPGGPGLQGLNLAIHGGNVYRIGGMSPHNKPGETASIFSVPDCARFNLATSKWESITPLPQPRSSHDVVVIDAKLIVVGGWTLKGPETTEWRNTLEVLDLASPNSSWTSIPQPFKRRALTAAAYKGKLYVMGGFDEHSKVIREVSIFDPKTSMWTTGPPLPGEGDDGFAPGACIHKGKLYVSVADGSLYRLNESETKWAKTGAATPRVAHRIVSDGDRILIIGGAANGRNSDLIESVSVDGPLTF